MSEKILSLIKKIIPRKIFKFFQPSYHWFLAFFSALIYWFPSQKLYVLGVTGTKGKTTVIGIINAILEEAGYKTSLISTLRFKIGQESKDNKLKMTMPGRFFVQKFLRKSVKAGVSYALLEMTSQGVLQFRHKFIGLDAMLFTNLAPEHIEAHGTFEKYREAKMRLFETVAKSKKPKKTIIINGDDENAKYFLQVKADEKIIYGLKDAERYLLKKDSTELAIDGIKIHSKLLGEFNVYNILAAVAFAKSQGIGMDIIKTALEKFSGVPGRVEMIDEGQDFKVVVDYAHTPDSLQKIYEVFQNSRRICVLGAAGGGRDKWKRSEMGKIAASQCDHIILTNEDPYDEDPRQILADIKSGIKKALFPSIHISKILDRRQAIRKALQIAKTGDTVLITGKGSEPWIMGPGGEKTKWDDREVAREELKKIIVK